MIAVSCTVIAVLAAVAVKNLEIIKFCLFLRCGIRFKDKTEMVENIADLDYDAFINYK